MSKFSRKAPKWRVYFNGRLQSNWHVVSCTQSVGGKRLDSAVLVADTGKSNTFENGFLLRGATDSRGAKVNSIKVEITESINDGAEIVRHWGKADLEGISINPSGEGTTLTSRIERYHFGRPLDGIQFWNPHHNTDVEVDLPLIFNPEIDGRTLGNMHPKRVNKRTNNHLFLSPESTRTAVSAKLHGGTPEQWVLSKAVHYLCQTLNDQKYIQNPDLQSIENIVDDDADRLENVSFPRRLTLPELLDRLLNPLGYVWFVALPGKDTRKITIFRRGVSYRSTTLRYLAPGKTFDHQYQEVEGLNLKMDTGAIINTLHGRGSPIRVEFTAELNKAWSTDSDGSDIQDLRTSVPEFEGVKDAYRKFVLNEAGDYTGLRPEIKAFDLTKIFTEKIAGRVAKDFDGNPKEIPRRRPLMPCLTVDSSGNPIGQVQGVLVEYSNPAYDSTEVSEGAEPEWLRIGSWGCQLLRGEAGIYFTGATPPEEMWRQGADLRVRVTATIESDYALQVDVDRNPQSLNTDDVIALLDFRDRFHLRYVSKLSQFFAEQRTTLAEDDTKVMTDYLERLRDSYDVADISGSVTLEGVDYTHIELGIKVLSIEGRNIGLGAGPGGTSKQPQIVAIEWKPQAQQAVVSLQRFRETIPVPR